MDESWRIETIAFNIELNIHTLRKTSMICSIESSNTLEINCNVKRNKYYINMHSPLTVGVDIGGSHITTSLVNLTTRSILKNSQHRELVDPNGGADNIINDWCNAINNNLNSLTVPIFKLGIAMPGPFDYELGISQVKGVEKFESLFGLKVKYYENLNTH